MSSSPGTPEEQNLRNINVGDQRVNLWRQISISTMVELVISRETNHIFVPQLDVMEFVMPDQNRFRTTDVYSDSELRGFVKRAKEYHPLVGDEVEYVLYAGRVEKDTLEEGLALPRDSRFLILQGFFDQQFYDRTAEEVRKEIEKKKSLKNNYPRRGRPPQSGSTRLL